MGDQGRAGVAVGERWGMRPRLVRALLAAPAPALSLVGGRPEEVDGRRMHPAVQAMVAVGDRLGQTEERHDPEAGRRQMRRITPLGMPRITGILSADRIVDGPGGPIEVRVYRPPVTAQPPAAIVYLHGGGWVTGDLDTHDACCRVLAAESACAVVAVHYRRAPEHLFPAAVDDALAAYRWVHEQALALDVAPGRIGVMGDSAGGNLAAVLAQLVRDDPELPDAAAQCLVYPAVDMTMSAPSCTTLATGVPLTRASMVWFREQYVPPGVDWKDPRISPLWADDLSGLPPALVVGAGFDPLRDDALRYAEALLDAGTPARHRCYDDQVHGFFGMGVLPGGMQRIREICSDMGRLMAGTPPREVPAG